MKRELSVVLAIVLVLGTFGAAKAVGGVEAGVKGGVNIANQTSNPDNQAPADSRTGLALGGFVGIPVLPNLHIQPEALFMMKGGEDSNAGTTSTYKLNYVEVPVLAKLTSRRKATGAVSAAAHSPPPPAASPSNAPSGSRFPGTLGTGLVLLGSAIVAEAASDQPGMSRTTAFLAGGGLGVSGVGGVMLYFDLSPRPISTHAPPSRAKDSAAVHP